MKPRSPAPGDPEAGNITINMLAGEIFPIDVAEVSAAAGNYIVIYP